MAPRNRWLQIPEGWELDKREGNHVKVVWSLYPFSLNGTGFFVNFGKGFFVNFEALGLVFYCSAMGLFI